MKIITGELRAEQQFIRIDDRMLTERYRHSYDVAYMPQYHFIPGFLTIRHILSDYGVAPDDLIEYFPEFTGRLRHLAGELSGGERRLLEFFIVVRSNAKFVILDEPFSHVMPVHIEVMSQIIKAEARHKGILMSDHLFRELIDICDDIYLVENSHVRHLASPQELVRWGYTNYV
jgi:ABC-type lipopolysaccharide export system ATPase subunit